MTLRNLAAALATTILLALAGCGGSSADPSGPVSIFQGRHDLLGLWAFDRQRDAVAAIRRTQGGAEALVVMQRLPAGRWIPLAPTYLLPPVGSVSAVVTSQGDVAVVWIDVASRNVNVATFTASRGWTAPVELDLPYQGLVLPPQIAADAEGRVFVTWLRSASVGGLTTPPLDLWAATGHPSSGWGPAYKLATGAVEDLVVAADRHAEGASLAWYDLDALGGSSVTFAEWRNGLGWAPPQLIETTSPGNVVGPQFLWRAMSRASGRTAFAYSVFRSVSGTDRGCVKTRVVGRRAQSRPLRSAQDRRSASREGLDDPRNRALAEFSHGLDPLAYRSELRVLRCAATVGCDPLQILGAPENTVTQMAADVALDGTATVVWAEQRQTPDQFIGQFSARLTASAPSTPTLITQQSSIGSAPVGVQMSGRTIAAWLGVFGNRALPQWSSAARGSAEWSEAQSLPNTPPSDGRLLKLAADGTEGPILAWIAFAPGTEEDGALVLADVPP